MCIVGAKEGSVLFVGIDGGGMGTMHTTSPFYKSVPSHPHHHSATTNTSPLTPNLTIYYAI